MSNSDSIVGLILAGGLARRMGGGDKCLLPLAGKTLLQRTIERAQPQVNKLLLNANGNSLRFARTRLPVIQDIYPNHRGPLAGIHAGMKWAQANAPEMEWLVSFASDSPFFPTSLVASLADQAKKTQAPLIIASSYGRRHPTFALWHKSLLVPMEQQLEQPGMPRLQDWMDQQSPAELSFSAVDYDPFFNINTPQDLYSAELLVPLIK